ncbi:autotransporter outer membrane beta-barrel domain-containing protein [Hoeflea prorocentri]|uniref:Autotransporter outer membrane beta-barrel domain-containing protein n=1 Tax=Hoeflea prorocentri TaxID=1922333 RepID=A0A9X3UKX1_9HYPH|nr:autotransporter outer membrane beta-barrel domain-containing protein [Hoeflea prorocentri]MCY6382447.1 autotransporter outer membrane beta-barrel domain-containing protein [Hoeflea prorocentri]MDA5400247.1 autotransporter outer membrane beta-barrel domain-containing protein [Hoeflea prorocentri]
MRRRTAWLALVWLALSLFGVGAHAAATVQISPASGTGNSVLLADGAAVSDVHDQVRNLNYAVTGESQITITFDWYADRIPLYGNTWNNGIHIKLFYYDGSSWSEIYSELVEGDQFVGVGLTTRLLNIWQTRTVVFDIPNPTSGVKYIRASIIDRFSSNDRLNQTRGCESCGSDPGGSTFEGSRHFDNADVSFEMEVTGTGLDPVDVTTGQIGAFTETRGRLILENQPQLERRLDRLNGTITNNGGVSGFGFAYRNGALPFEATLGRERASLSYSLLRSRAPAELQGLSGDVTGLANALVGSPPDEAGASTVTNAFDRATVEALDNNPPGADPPRQRYDIWAEGTFSRFNAAAGDGNFGVVHTGMDYLFTENILLGLGSQFDWTDMNAPDGTGSVTGWGFMVGPYGTARLAPNLIVDARAAWGRSYNEVSPLATYQDDFDAGRWLATGALVGEFSTGGLTILPEARLSWFREQSDAYVDSLGAVIPEVTVETGTFEFGPTISAAMPLDNGMTFVPFTTVTGIWTFAQRNTATTVSGQPRLAEEGVRSQLEIGFDAKGENGFSLSASGFYDGLGDEDFEAYGGTIGLRHSF